MGGGSDKSQPVAGTRGGAWEPRSGHCATTRRPSRRARGAEAPWQCAHQARCRGPGRPWAAGVYRLGRRLTLPTGAFPGARRMSWPPGGAPSTVRHLLYPPPCPQLGPLLRTGRGPCTPTAPRPGVSPCSIQAALPAPWPHPPRRRWGRPFLPFVRAAESLGLSRCLVILTVTELTDSTGPRQRRGVIQPRRLWIQKQVM